MSEILIAISSFGTGYFLSVVLDWKKFERSLFIEVEYIGRRLKYIESKLDKKENK